MNILADFWRTFADQRALSAHVGSTQEQPDQVEWSGSGSGTARGMAGRLSVGLQRFSVGSLAGPLGFN